MTKDNHNNACNQLVTVFSKLKDPRVAGRCLHKLIDIVVITVCAIISGAKHWNEIAEFGRERLSWLEELIELANGIPSDKTFCRIFSLIPPCELLDCFSQWSKESIILSNKDIIAIDGKTLRKSRHQEANQNPLHLINAFVTTQGITLGAIKTPDKSNEIKGIPPLLKSLPIEGCTITIDAMGTQKGIANLIKIRGADYVLALKKNHKKLYKKIEGLFHRSRERGYEAMTFKQENTVDYEHSRYEKREYTFLPMMYFPFEKRCGMVCKHL